MAGFYNRSLEISMKAVIGCAFLYGSITFYIPGKPYMRGFYCNDQTINKPFLSSTVPSFVLGLVSVSTVALSILFIELYQFIHYTERKSHISDIKGDIISRTMYHPVYRKFVKVFAVYYTCASMQEFFVDVVKYSVGVLRPHFLTACNPDFTLLNCTNPDGTAKYIFGDEYCRWTVDDKYRIETRLSFPSGHASHAGIPFYICSSYTTLV